MNAIEKFEKTLKELGEIKKFVKKNFNYHSEGYKLSVDEKINKISKKADEILGEGNWELRLFWDYFFRYGDLFELIALSKGGNRYCNAFIVLGKMTEKKQDFFNLIW
jgi:hypothetical protein